MKNILEKIFLNEKIILAVILLNAVVIYLQISGISTPLLTGLDIACTFEKTALTPVTIEHVNKAVTYSADGIDTPEAGMFIIPEGAGDVSYAVTVEDGDTGAGTCANNKLTVTKCGTFTVKVNTAATDTHAAAEAAATLTVNKAVQTINASEVTATYGDTGKSVSASVTEPVTDGGAISYAVKSGSEEYIDVDAASGALTIRKAGTAAVILPRPLNFNTDTP